MDEALLAVTKVGVLTFVVAGMAATGLQLTPASILRQLRDVRLVIGLLLANFVVVPAIAVAFVRVFPVEEAAGTAVTLLACCAGAPFLPTLARLAKGDAALAVGGMVLLMVLTVAYAPLVVPAVVQGATVSAWDIASSLIVLMLIPLAVGLLVRARYADLADSWQGPVGHIASAGLAIGVVAGLLASWREVLSSVGSWILVGTAVVLAAGLVTGFFVAPGRSRGDRTVLALATAQRNISAALVIAVTLSPDVAVRTLVAALLVPIVLIALAGEIGKRRAVGESAAQP